MNTTYTDADLTLAAYRDDLNAVAPDGMWFGLRRGGTIITPARKVLVEDADGALHEKHVAVPQLPHPDDRAIAVRLGLDPARIIYDEWGEAWYDGAPLWAHDGEEP